MMDGMAELSRPHATLTYEVRGDGPVLGYAHGMLLSRAGEDAMGVLDWSVLAQHRRLVRYDARAHGQSTGRPVPDDYVWPELADDLLAVVDEVSPDAPVDWMGASMGCGTLLWAATKAPQRFRRLVLVIPPTTGETRAGSAGMYRTGADVVEAEGLSTWLAALQQFATPEIFATVPGYGLKVDVTETLLPSVLRGAAQTDLPDAAALAGLAQPTLILSWETDPVHPVSTGQLLADTLPQAHLHVSSTVDDVRTWAGRVAAFLDE